jgi:signal transduction histidine kinase
MGGIGFPVQVAFAALAAAQMAALLARFLREGHAGILRWCVFLVLLAGRLVCQEKQPFAELLSAAVVWSAGDALLSRPGVLGRPVWGLLNCLFIGALLLAAALGYRDSLPLRAFHAFVQALLAAYPLFLLCRAYHGTRAAVYLVLAAAGSAVIMAAAVDLALAAVGHPDARLTLWLLCALSAATGYAVLGEGFPPSRGELGGRAGRERSLTQVYARILESENALLLQDRLIVSGLLALGAAHEFKNVLGHIKATAEFGMGQQGLERKQESLRLLASHAESGGRSAVELLEQLAREGREEPKETDLGDLVSRFVRLVRPACRTEGIMIQAEVPSPLRLATRLREVEQVLFNLVRNAQDAFRRQAGNEGKIIQVALRRAGASAVIEVRDNAGGLPEGVSRRLFRMSPSPSGGTGVGLYLSRSLAERNGGSLDFEAREGGSCFRLALPLEPGEPAGDAQGK